MVIPLIIRGAGMVAKGKNFGGSAKNIAQQGWDVAQTGWQNAPNMVQQGWQKMPGSAKIGAGAGLMGGLAVGGFKGVGKGHDFVKKKIGEKSTLILVFPFLLVLMDYALNKNGIELNSFFGFLFSGGSISNIVIQTIASIATSAPYLASVIIYWIFRRPKSRVEWVYPFVLFMMFFFVLSFGGGNFWVLIHALFALFTFMYLLEGFNQDAPITNVHWIFLIIMFMDIFGLATITKVLPDILFL